MGAVSRLSPLEFFTAERSSRFRSGRNQIGTFRTATDVTNLVNAYERSLRRNRKAGRNHEHRKTKRTFIKSFQLRNGF